MHFYDKIELIAEGFIPELAVSAEIKAEFLENFKYFFNDLDENSAGKLKLLSAVVLGFSYAYNFKSISALSVTERSHYLERLSNFPVPKIVAGLTGLRSLIMVAFYSAEFSWKKIGYDGPLVNRSIA